MPSRPRGKKRTTITKIVPTKDIQFTVIDPTMGYGFVIHGLTLY